MLKTRIAVFVSGGGTNLQALLYAQAAGKIPPAAVRRPLRMRCAGRCARAARR